MWGGALEDTACRLGVFSGEEDAFGDGIWTPGVFLDQEKAGAAVHSPQTLQEAEVHS